MARSRPEERRRWLVAVALALVLHGGSVWGLLVLRPWEPVELTASEIEASPVEFTFLPPESSAREEPRFFSELPEDRADVAPDEADALSNVDSRARDLAAGGEDGGLPQLEGESEALHVGVRPDGGAFVPPREAPEGPAQEASPPASPVAPQDRGDRAAPVRDPRRELLTPSSPPPSTTRLERTGGVTDFLQEEMQNPGGNVALFGDVSLNTLAWEYAPWLQRFRREFMRNWYAPNAYSLGIIDGWTEHVLVIQPDGTLRSLETVGQADHSSFHPSLLQSSLSALKATAPFHPLPEDFPEETLVLRLKLIYPELRRR